MLTKESVNKWLSEYYIIEEEANNIIREYCEIWNPSFKRYYFSKIEDSELIFEGDDYSMGDHDYRTLNLPISYLYTPWQDIEQQKYKEHLLKMLETKRKKEENELEEKRKLYEKLKNEFEKDK